jgi:hypothetical protein
VSVIRKPEVSDNTLAQIFRINYNISMFSAIIRNKDKKPGKAAVDYTLTGKSWSLRSNLQGEAAAFAPAPGSRLPAPGSRLPAPIIHKRTLRVYLTKR